MVSAAGEGSQARRDLLWFRLGGEGRGETVQVRVGIIRNNLYSLLY